MDLDELRTILSTSKVDVWSFIDSAITLASLDCGEELRDRRDGIVQKLYFPTATSSSSSGQLCRNCHNDAGLVEGNQLTRHHQQRESQQRQDQNRNQQQKMPVHRGNSKSPLTPESNPKTNDNNGIGNDDDDLDPLGGLLDDEQAKILHIRDQLEDPEQDEESLVELLQNLVDMDITFKALQETDIGRIVSGFRKQHPSNEVRKLAKLLVRNWKETVDEWVRLNQPEQASVSLIGDGDSPQLNMQQKNQQNGHYQGSDFAYSPNPQNWGSGSEKNYSESESKVKSAPSREAPSRPPQSASAPPPKSASAPPPSRLKEPSIDLEKLNSARRRLQENYQEAQNAKKQRTIQMMDLHDLPKPKNAFFAKNKGGFQGRNNHR